MDRTEAYVVERDDAVLGNERTHLQLVGGGVRGGRAAAAQGVRGQGQMVCKGGERLLKDVRREREKERKECKRLQNETGAESNSRHVRTRAVSIAQFQDP